MSVLEFIKECQEKVFSGTHISAEDAKKLLNIPDENLKDLAKCANENLKMYQKNNLIKKIQKTSKIFENFYQEISEIDIVGDIRHKGMIMGIELVTDKSKKTPIHPKKSINKIFFEHGKKNGIYLRTLGNIVMIVPPLVISENELNSLLNRTIKTIKSAKPNLI